MGRENIKDYVFFVHYENFGNTVATDVRSWIKTLVLPREERTDVSFTLGPPGPPAVLGPHSSVGSNYSTLPITTMIQCWQGEVDIYMWSRVEYMNTFEENKLYFHEQCARLGLLRNPSDILPANHAPIVVFTTYGSQNKVGSNDHPGRE